MVVIRTSEYKNHSHEGYCNFKFAIVAEIFRYLQKCSKYGILFRAMRPTYGNTHTHDQHPEGK